MTVYSFSNLTSGRAYKYVEPQFVEGAMRGTFRVAPLRQYADLEDAQCDALDGAVERFRHNVVMMPGESPQNEENKRLLDSMKVADFGNTRFTAPLVIGSVRSITHSRGHALCLCDRPDSKAFGAKTAIIEIAEVRRLAEILSATNPELGADAAVAAVVYQPVSFDAALDCPEPDPFVKGPKFKPESEIRILWPEPRVSGVVFTRQIVLPAGLLTLLSAG